MLNNVNEEEKLFLKSFLKDVSDNGHTVLYLARSGSYLHGTATKNSDTDFKGVFLPSQESCFLGKAPGQFSQSSKENKNAKSTSDDVEVELFSLQKFLKLTSKSDSSGLDLLFSSSYKNAVVFSTPEFNQILSQKNSLFDIIDNNGYIAFALSQARKYGIKGSRYKVVKAICDFFNSEIFNDCQENKVSEFMNVLDTFIQEVDSKYLFIKDDKDRNNRLFTYLNICDTKHDVNIRVHEMIDRLTVLYNQYGHRSKKATEGSDFKALSHALRAIYQTQEILVSGQVEFPLRNANILRDVKVGRYSDDEINKLIEEGLSTVDELKSGDYFRTSVDENVIRFIILNSYK